MEKIPAQAMIKTGRTDLWDEEVSVGDKVRFGLKSYTVRYGNFKYFGTERIGLFLENIFQSNPSDTMPLAQAKTIVKIKNADGEKIYN